MGDLPIRARWWLLVCDVAELLGNGRLFDFALQRAADSVDYSDEGESTNAPF